MSSMHIHIGGTRGSYAVPGPSTLHYGGNTTSFMVTKEKDGRMTRVIIDMGTGVIGFGKKIIGDFFAKKAGLKIPILFTHQHPDHTQGFPFFAPSYFPSADLHFIGMETLKKNIGDVLVGIMQPPMFPIEMKDMKSKKTYHVVSDGQKFVILWDGTPLFNGAVKPEEVCFEVICMKAYAPSHPQQGAMYYRITDPETGNSFCAVWDLESRPGGDQRVIAFAKGTTVMAHDTMYTDEEYNSDKLVVQGFGHSTYSMAIDNAVKAGAKQLLCMHYNPDHGDDFLNDYYKSVDAMAAMTGDGKLQVTFAIEGQVYGV